MRRLIDSLLSRWYVRRSLLDVSIDNTTQALRIIDEWKQLRNATPRTRTGPEVVITTDYKQAPCS